MSGGRRQSTQTEVSPPRAPARFEWLNGDSVSTQFVEHWRALGLAACTPNAYLMPEFLLPAARYLAPDTDLRFAALWNADRSALLALGVLADLPASWRFPFARLSTFRSRHSFQSGVLLRSEIEAAAVDRFVHGLFESSQRVLRLMDVREDSVAFRQIRESAQRCGLAWFLERRYLRASIRLGGCGAWRTYIPASRHRRLRRQRARLERLGDLQFRVVHGKDISDDSIDTFLRLEGMGWKRETAIAATSADTQFFYEVASAFRKRDLIFFCELLLDGQIVACTTNFRIGASGFAFKVAYDTTYAKLSPGIIAEYAFLESAERTCPHLHEIESGSQAGSYIESLWPERIPMVSGNLVKGRLRTAAVSIKEQAKGFKRHLRGGSSG